ncbi:baculoviral IAP repeat-containing protein 2-like isoform X3, partial [Biomphalaria pfeifferi]
MRSNLNRPIQTTHPVPLYASLSTGNGLIVFISIDTFFVEIKQKIYSADGNCTRCFECGIGLRNWQPSDDVWIEHAKCRKTCAWLLEKGQKFIHDVAQIRGQMN